MSDGRVYLYIAQTHALRLRVKAVGPQGKINFTN